MQKIIKYLIYFIILIVLILIILGKINTSKIKNGNLNFSKGWQGQLIEIDGETIRYIQKGKGQDVLLIHGTPGSIEDWNIVIDSLSKNYKVTAFDRLGSGFSTAKKYNYTIDDNVNLTNKLIEKLKLDSVVVVGHSYGGTIATNMATQKNENIKSFVIAAAPLYVLNPDFTYKLLATPLIGKGITAIFASFAAPKMIEDGLKASFGNNAKLLTKDFITKRVQIWSQPKVLYATSNVRTNFNENIKSVTINYKNITKKISFLVGEYDYKTILSGFETIKAEIPHAEFLFLKKTSHYIQFEKTETLIKVIKNHHKLTEKEI